MNFLAHQALSGNHPEIQIGNFIADFLRGEKPRHLPEMVRKGIELHRSIDAFTDQHPVILDSKKMLQPVFGKYSPVLIDLYLDHFLGKHWNRFHDSELHPFTELVFKNFHDYFHLLPSRAKSVLPYMVWENWLFHYQFDDGMQKAMKGLGRRAKFENHFESKGVLFLQQHRTELEAAFLQFYPDVLQLKF
jgi:acyl carrier protein phosphodiesterase